MPSGHWPKTVYFVPRVISGHREFGPGTDIFQPRRPAGTGQKTVKFELNFGPISEKHLAFKRVIPYSLFYFEIHLKIAVNNFAHSI